MYLCSMYGASKGDTGIFDNKYKGVVRAVAIWSPYEHVVVFFKNSDCHYTSFKRAKIVLTEKTLDFRIDSYYSRNDNIDFCGSELPKFIQE